MYWTFAVSWIWQHRDDGDNYIVQVWVSHDESFQWWGTGWWCSEKICKKRKGKNCLGKKQPNKHTNNLLFYHFSACIFKNQPTGQRDKPRCCSDGSYNLQCLWTCPYIWAGTNDFLRQLLLQEKDMLTHRKRYIGKQCSENIFSR